MITHEEAVKRYNFCKIGPDGVLELYADHHMLSSLRTCEGYFMESIINSIGMRGGRAWSLEFGIWFHTMMEYFYQADKQEWKGHWKYTYQNGEKHKYETTPANWCEIAKFEWQRQNLDAFCDQKQYKSLGGLTGALGILLGYFQVYGTGKERLRLVGTEMPFGRGKEVPIRENPQEFSEWFPWPVRCYYTGRMDALFDAGKYGICVNDFKTTAYFDGSESADFKPHDGIQGYVFAASSILKKYFPQKYPHGSDTGIITHVSLKDPGDPALRFKRSYKTYSPEEMEEWRRRQIRTFKRVYELSVLEAPPEWNTGIQCSNMYFRDCPFKPLHSVTPSARNGMFATLYVQGEAWNPYPTVKTEHATPGEK